MQCWLCTVAVDAVSLGTCGIWKHASKPLIVKLLLGPHLIECP